MTTTKPEESDSSSVEMSLATDILLDANMLDKKRLEMLYVCQDRGDDPVKLARKLVGLR